MMKYYHLSTSKKPLNLTPRVPDNFFTKNGYEDGKTARVCFSTSIDGCLAALSMNLEGKKFFIHAPDNYKGRIKDNSYVKTKVPDAKITGEVWFLDTVKTKIIGEVTVGSAKEEPQVFYYGKNKAELYFWNYRVKWFNNLTEQTLFLREMILC